MATTGSPSDTRANCYRFREAETGVGTTVLQDRRSMLARRHSLMSPADSAMGASSDATRVGAELREARERLGWSLSDVAANLRIRYVYLLALEEGRVSDLPGMAYAVGFLRAYAKLL